MGPLGGPRGPIWDTQDTGPSWSTRTAACAALGSARRVKSSAPRLGYIILERENRKALMSMEKHPLPSMKMMYILPGEKCKVCNGKYERRAV
jgi:hypothetical protein